MNQYTYSNNQQRPQELRIKAKAKALEALEMALFNEEYERCAQLVRAARMTGAQPAEIRKSLASFITSIVEKEKGGKKSSARF